MLLLLRLLSHCFLVSTSRLQHARLRGCRMLRAVRASCRLGGRQPVQQWLQCPQCLSCCNNVLLLHNQAVSHSVDCLQGRYSASR